MSKLEESKIKNEEKNPLAHIKKSHSDLVMEIAKQEAKRYEQTLKNLVHR